MSTLASKSINAVRERRFSSRIQRIKPSPTTMAAAKARALKAQGHPVISLTTGEPDFPTPDFILDAANRAMRAGETRYTNVGGTDALKDAIKLKFERDNGLNFAHDEVMAGTGGKQIIFNALMTTVDHGDEVIIPAPYWVSYPDIVSLAGGQPVFVETNENSGFKITADALLAAITDKTRWLMLNSPSNPTGATYSHDELLALAEVLREVPHVWVLSDDIYEHIIYSGAPYTTIAAVAPDLKDRILTINGVSKCYSMTGWRLGFCGGPADLINAMSKLQSQSTSSPCAVSQAASLVALTGPQEIVAERTALLKARRDRLFPRFSEISGLDCVLPEGAFYFYVSVAGLIGRKTAAQKKLLNDDDVNTYLLESHHLALVSGRSFGLSPFVRISFAAADDVLDAAFDHLRDACAELY